MALSMGVSLATAVFAYRRRDRVPSARAFALIPLSHAAWTGLEIAEILAPNLASKLFFDGLGWLPGLGMVAGSLWFGYEYAGRRVKPGLWLAILGLPLVAIALLITEPWHHRVHPDAWVRVDRIPPSLEYAWGWIDWSLIAYGLVMVGVACALVVRRLVRAPAAYIGQTAIVLTGLGLAPVAGLVALALGVRSFGQRDPAPIVFGLADLVVAFGLFSRSLFDLAPLACEAVVAGLADGVLVCDQDGRIVDANAALC